MMGTEQDLRRIAELASEAADRVAKQDDPALGALLIEMQALEDVLPGLGSARTVVSPRVRNTAIDAEIEA
ncbi:hypothetical protein, partial [Pseudotabrizicola sp.]